VHRVGIEPGTRIFFQNLHTCSYNSTTKAHMLKCKNFTHLIKMIFVELLLFGPAGFLLLLIHRLFPFRFEIDTKLIALYLSFAPHVH